MATTSNKEYDEVNERILEALDDKYTKMTTVIDSLTKSTGLGSVSDAYQQMLGGINHRGLGNPVSLNRDTSGIVLMSRPYLNLSYDNASLCRLMMPLLTKNEFTLQRYIRAMLDPKGHKGIGLESTAKINCPLLSEKNPFMPLLTNNLLSVSGWPDVVADTHTSKEGLIKESWSMIDGFAHIKNRFDLTLNFRNVEGDPITATIFTWLLYATMIRRGKMYPYAESVINKRIDYCTRIYHLITDPSKRYVTKIAATGASFPTTVPIGAAFNYTGDQSYVSANEQLSFNFACIGADYNDPITIREFNRLVGMFNPDMRIAALDNTTMRLAGEGRSAGNGGVFRLHPSELSSANYYGTPLIHPKSSEIMWYVTEEELIRMNS